MLRRRILASAMASVMAIGSIAVVANAEDTAVAEKNVKSKADLEALVKGYDKFREDGVYDYGTLSAQKFQDAADYADNVLADSDSTAEDYTAAYIMLETARKKCVLYTADELKKLIDGCKKTFETDNILNEDLSDLIYDEDSFVVFSDAYVEAESVVTSGDTRLITDAYEKLDAANKGLKEITPITKASFRTALKNYEACIKELSKYDSWRRGTAGGWFDDDYTVNYWALQKNVKDGVSSFKALTEVTFGYGAFSKDGWFLEVGSDYKKYVDDSWVERTAYTPIIPIYGSELELIKAIDEGKAMTVQEYVTAAYENLDAEKGIVKTTNEGYVDAYNICVRATEIFKNWTADNTTRANKASVTQLLDKYHKQLVAQFKATSAEKLYMIVNGADSTIPTDWQDANHQYFAAELKNDDVKKTVTWEGEDITIANKVSILKYVDVSSKDIVNNDELKSALEKAEKYLADDYGTTNDVWGLDETGAVTIANGSVTEWTLINRKLKYELEDAYSGSAEATYDKADVNKLIDLCYELADKTGDAHIFEKEHNELVALRQDALDWVRAANKIKKYKKETQVPVENGQFDLATSTTVYKTVKNKYDELEKLYGDYAYGYDEIYAKLYEVAGKIDSDTKYDVDSLKTALTETAYALSSLSDVATSGNEPFTSEREFVAYNRLHTANNAKTGGVTGEESNLKAKYETLLAEVKKVEEVVIKLGDVDGDGDVDMLDAKALLDKIVAKEEVDVKVGDFDGNSKVEIADAKAILEAYNKNGNKPL